MFRARQKVGQYRIVKKLSSGPLADVFEAFDTILQSRCALKVPSVKANKIEDVPDFVAEARVAAKLEHPNILRIQNAAFIDGHFIIAMPLGVESLADRLERRIAAALALDYATQALHALAYAHEQRIIHCDIKPENYILFADKTLMLADFGFAKVSLRTLKASGSGTIDYIAPEQAMGRPKFQSDVFSLGLVLYKLFAGVLPEYPFDWPPPNHARLIERSNKAMAEVIQKAINPDPRKRFVDAIQMLRAFEKAAVGARRQRARSSKSASATGPAWQRVRWREFKRDYRAHLELKHQCRHCEGPVAMAMHACPWCGTDNPAAGAESNMPAHCPRCERGVKLDWQYCAWCYGPGFEVETERRYPDKRYSAKCQTSGCGGPLMPHMRYCPWCRSKVAKRWSLKPRDPSCKTCGQAVAADYWHFCGWCREPLDATNKKKSRVLPRKR